MPTKTKPKDKPHQTKNIIIKKADIDINIIPVVKWLNSFDVVTLYSCEGDEGDCIEVNGRAAVKDTYEESDGTKVTHYMSRPYVLFICNDFLDLIKITQKTQHYAKVIVNCEQRVALLRFSLRFNSKSELNKFVSTL